MLFFLDGIYSLCTFSFSVMCFLVYLALIEYPCSVMSVVMSTGLGYVGKEVRIACAGSGKVQDLPQGQP